MSIDHLPKAADVLPINIQTALRMAVARRFSANGAWIKPAQNEQQSTIDRIDKIVAQAKKQCPNVFRTE